MSPSVSSLVNHAWSARIQSSVMTAGTIHNRCIRDISFLIMTFPPLGIIYL